MEDFKDPMDEVRDSEVDDPYQNEQISYNLQHYYEVARGVNFKEPAAIVKYLEGVSTRAVT